VTQQEIIAYWLKADYRPLVSFDLEQVKEILEKSDGFVCEMRNLYQLSET
jgi:hypothetical protein